MPTLSIEGQTVNVDDSFLKLSHDEQNATVDEIAKSLKPAEPVHTVFSGSILPISRDSEGKVHFDSNAGIVGALKSALTLPGDVMSGKVGIPSIPEMQTVPGAVQEDDPSGQDFFRRSIDFAGAASPVNPAVAAGDRVIPGLARGPQAVAPAVASDAATAGNGIVDAAARVTDASGIPVTVPRAFSSDSMITQRGGQLARNVPFVGDSIPKATSQMVDQLGDAVRSLADTHGQGSGPNVASRIGRTLSDAGSTETTSARAAADTSDNAVLSDWERAHTDAANTIQTGETNALTQARAAVGDMSPQDMGQTLIARLRAGEQQARANKERLYEAAGNSDGAISADAVRGARNTVAQSLDHDGVVIDNQLTPAANRMMTELDNISSLRIPNRVAAPVPEGSDIAAVNMQGIEQTRKRLNSIAQAASNDADRRASRRVIGAFDDWLNDSFDNALFSGSDSALHSFRAARAANADWRTRFGFNARDDADRVVNRIVTGETTPQEAANYIVGASKVGAKGVSSRLLTRIAEATGNDPESLQAIRGGIWNRLSQATEGTTAKPPVKVANDIYEFLGGSGRDVAQRIFTPEQQGIMRTYADTLRHGGQARDALAQVAKNTKPSPMQVNIGPMADLASSVLGRNGKTDEALFNAIDSYAKTGSRGDIHTLANIVRNIPEKDKGDLAGAIIRKMGHSTQTNSFSPDLFASEWSKYSPQAKSILLGNAGPQRQALDDIAAISQRYKDIGKRFGNPSGTGQQVTGAAALASVVHSPFVAIPSLMGGAVFSKVLASPAGASSAAKWGKAFEALKMSPTASHATAFQIASRNLANTAATFGSKTSPADLMRLIQSPSSAAADNDQQKIPRRVGQ